MNSKMKLGAIALLIAFATKDKWTPYVLEKPKDEEISSNTEVGRFYLGLAEVVEKDRDHITNTGQFRDAHQKSAMIYAHTKNIPTKAGRREQISKTIEEAIGLENQKITDELRVKLVGALRKLGSEL